MIQQLEMKQAGASAVLALTNTAQRNYLESGLDSLKITLAGERGREALPEWVSGNQITEQWRVMLKLEINAKPLPHAPEGEPGYSYADGLLYEAERLVDVERAVVRGSTENGAVPGESYYLEPVSFDMPELEAISQRIACKVDGSFSNIPLRVSIKARREAGIVSGTEYTFGSIGSLNTPKLTNPPAVWADPVTIGMETIVTVAKAGITRTLHWSIGEAGGYIGNEDAEAPITDETTFRWRVPLEAAYQLPDSWEGKVRLEVKQYDSLLDYVNEKPVHTGSGEVAVTVGSYIMVTPVRVTDLAEYREKYGKFVENQSICRVECHPKSWFGARVSVTVTCGQLTASGEDVRFLMPGDVKNIRVHIEDSRGYTQDKTVPVEVYPYTVPTAVLHSAERCNAAGEPQWDGDYVKVVFSGGVTSLDGQNTSEYRIHCRQRGASYAEAFASGHNGEVRVDNASVIVPASADMMWELFVRVWDDFGFTDSQVLIVPVGWACIDIDRSERALGFARRASHAGHISIGLPVDMSEKRITNMAEPEESSDAATKGYVDSMLAALRRELGM